MRLILCGGGSGEQNYLANKKLNEIINHSKPILYVPLALNEVDYPYDGCYEWIKTELSQVDVPKIDMVRSFEELSNKNYDYYSAIFIGGGNTYKLLKGIKEYGCFSKIKDYIDNDGIIIGSSAGAVIFSKDINIIAAMDLNDVNLKDTVGFNAMNGISIFPHYMNKKSSLSEEDNTIRLNKFTDAINKFSLTVGDVIAIPEEDAVFINGESISVIGEKQFYYFKNGIKEEFSSDNNDYIKKIR